MSIYSSLGIAISGLKGQSFALSHISGNLANSQTIGFKRTETSFAELVPNASYTRQIAGGVDAFTRGTNDVQGDVRQSSSPTHMSINGDGFFIVGEQGGQAGGVPTFAGGDLYTRRGDFEFDRHGHLVNGAGYFLKGIPVNAQSGNLAGGTPEIVRITNDLLPAQATSEITLRANLASFPMTANADPNDPDSALLDTGILQNGDVPGDEKDAFLNQSISGGAITVYDEGGGAHNLQLRWAKTANADPNAAPPVRDTWNLFYLSDPDAQGNDAAWINAGVDYDFDSNGRLAAPASGQVALTGVNVKGAALGDIGINHGQSGLTQFAEADGTAQLTEFRQNGYAAGELIDIAISDAGRIVGTYSNGRTVDLYQVQLASFNAPNRLQKLDGGAFRVSADSGDAILGASGTIIGASLEGSNTDIADEFTKLIVTQQAYSAGTRVVSTSNDMLAEALNMVR